MSRLHPPRPNDIRLLLYIYEYPIPAFRCVSVFTEYLVFMGMEIDELRVFGKLHNTRIIHNLDNLLLGTI